MFQIKLVVHVSSLLGIYLLMSVSLSGVVHAQEISSTSVQAEAQESGMSVSANSGQTAVVNYLDYIESTQNHNFNFYAGIVIVAALLLYLMLRRLPPEKEVSSENPPNELR